MSLDTDETTAFLNRFSVFILGDKLLSAFIEPFKLRYSSIVVGANITQLT